MAFEAYDFSGYVRFMWKRKRKPDFQFIEPELLWVCLPLSALFLLFATCSVFREIGFDLENNIGALIGFLFCWCIFIPIAVANLKMCSIRIWIENGNFAVRETWFFWGRVFWYSFSQIEEQVIETIRDGDGLENFECRLKLNNGKTVIFGKFIFLKSAENCLECFNELVATRRESNSLE